MDQKSLNLKEILVLNTYWLGLSFMWNSLHVIILPAILIFMVPPKGWINETARSGARRVKIINA